MYPALLKEYHESWTRDNILDKTWDNVTDKTGGGNVTYTTLDNATDKIWDKVIDKLG